MRSYAVAAFFLASVVESFHVNTVGRPHEFHSSRSSSRAGASVSPLRMGAPSLPNAESLRKTAASTAAALLIAFSPAVASYQHAFAADGAGAQELSPAEMLVKKTTDMQRKRLKDESQEQLQGDVTMQEGDLIARVLVSIKQDLYDLGAPDTTGFPAVDTDEARLIVAAFGKDGPPVAAKRLAVKGRQFPVTIELTADDLAFPLTKDAWRLDSRSKEDIGLAVEIDPDGRAATLDSESLTGYGVSKPLRIGAQLERTEAAVELVSNPQLKERAEQALPNEGIQQLERVDAMLDYKEAKAPKGGKAGRPFG
ncbi:unnamed protein product [Ectocarpus sp. 12 AP-2014]